VTRTARDKSPCEPWAGESRGRRAWPGRSARGARRWKDVLLTPCWLAPACSQGPTKTPEPRAPRCRPAETCPSHTRPRRGLRCHRRCHQRRLGTGAGVSLCTLLNPLGGPGCWENRSQRLRAPVAPPTRRAAGPSPCRGHRVRGAVLLPGGCSTGHGADIPRRAPCPPPQGGRKPSPPSAGWPCPGSFALDPTSFVFTPCSRQKVRNLLVVLRCFSFPGDKLKDPKPAMSREGSRTVLPSAALEERIIRAQNCDQARAPRRFFTVQALPFSPASSRGAGEIRGSGIQRRRAGHRAVLALERENAGSVPIFGCHLVCSLDWCHPPQGHRSNADLGKSRFTPPSCRTQIQVFKNIKE